MEQQSTEIYWKDIKNRTFRNAIMKRFVTQVQFAEAAEVDEAVISLIIRGKRKPTINQKEHFAKLLKQPVEELFDD